MSLLSSRRRGIGGRGPAHPAAIRGRTVIVGDTRRAAPRLRHRRHRQSTARGTIAAIVSPAPRARPSSGTIPEWWQHLQGWNLRALLNHLQGHQTRRSARILLPARRRASLLTSASPAIPDGHQAPLRQSRTATKRLCTSPAGHESPLGDESPPLYGGSISKGGTHTESCSTSKGGKSASASVPAGHESPRGDESPLLNGGSISKGGTFEHYCTKPRVAPSPLSGGSISKGGTFELSCTISKGGTRLSGSPGRPPSPPPREGGSISKGGTLENIRCAVRAITLG